MSKFWPILNENCEAEFSLVATPPWNRSNEFPWIPRWWQPCPGVSFINHYGRCFKKARPLVKESNFLKLLKQCFVKLDTWKLGASDCGCRRTISLTKIYFFQNYFFTKRIRLSLPNDNGNECFFVMKILSSLSFLGKVTNRLSMSGLNT